LGFTQLGSQVNQQNFTDFTYGWAAFTVSPNTCFDKLQYEVSFQTTAGLIESTWFTVDVTARSLILNHVAALTEDSVVLVNVRGYLTGENMPDARMEFTITV
jgi:hypothetical protein